MNLRSYVQVNGYLDERLILKKESLYQGTNGRHVERFYISPSQSFIFKPLTNQSQKGKEIWVYENILTLFLPFFPKILAYNLDNNSAQNWIVFEDVGMIEHIFNKEIALKVVRQMAKWHSYPTHRLEGIGIQGQKPSFDNIRQTIIVNQAKIASYFQTLEIPKGMLEKFYIPLFEKANITQEFVFSHGDLHIGNYGLANEKLIVLDWEHAHLTTPYWDFYHLIDLSHPMFPKTVTPAIREAVLESYAKECKIEDLSAFKQDYYLFSATFSIWMLLLILNDIENNDLRWSKDKLNHQLEETVKNLKQCINQIG